MQFMAFNLNTIRFFIATLLLLVGQYTFAKTDIYASNGYYTSTVTWEKSKSPYILHVDVNIEKRGTLIIEPGVEVIGNYKKIKVGGKLYAGYVEGHNNDNPKNEKVTIKNTYLEAAGIGDRIMNLSHLKMTGGQIYISNRDRPLTQDFILKNSTLTYLVIILLKVQELNMKEVLAQISKACLVLRLIIIILLNKVLTVMAFTL